MFCVFPPFLRSGPTYKKVVFREYEKDFRQAKTHPSWLGKCCVGLNECRLSGCNNEENPFPVFRFTCHTDRNIYFLIFQRGIVMHVTQQVSQKEQYFETN